MKKYFFILGNNPALSQAEILAWLENNNYDYRVLLNGLGYIILETNASLPQDILNFLGGTIKFGEILQEIEFDKIFFENILDFLKPGDKKYNFGFSVYQENKQVSFKLRGLGLEIKKEFKSRGISSRLVMSRQENLSSVIVQKNKMLGETGAEIVFLKNEEKYFLGKTIGVQPFEELGRRDFGRPARDDYSGMLPPKLALIMINLAQIKTDQTVLDPFCGSGTILQELLLQGKENIIGSDLSSKAVADSRKNIKWLADNFSIKTSAVKLVEADAHDLPGKLENKIDAIVTEPFLGPPVRGRLNEKEANKIIGNLTSLYQQTFKSFAQILKPGARVVVVFPVYTVFKKELFLPVEIIVAQKKFKQIFPPAKFYRLSRRNTLIYSRSDQTVSREILVFEYVGQA